eukprot:680076-Pleurochrysis_carterae.AAC.1
MASQAAYDVYYTSVEEAETKLQRFMPAHHIIPRYTDSHSTVIENSMGARESRSSLLLTVGRIHQTLQTCCWRTRRSLLDYHLSEWLDTQ